MAKKDLYKNAPAAAPDLRDLSSVPSMLAPRRTIVRDLPIDRIEPNPYQPRTHFSEEEIEELAQAIREQGFTSRIRVRQHPQHPGTFQIVYGERRWRAAQQAGMSEIPAEIAEHSDEEMMVIALTENLQRVDLNPIEEARGFQMLLEHDPTLSYSRLAERVGKKVGYIRNRLELLKLPADIQEMVLQRADTIRAARDIARLDDAALRQTLISAVLADDMAQAEVSRRVREILAPPPATPDSTGSTHIPETVPADRRAAEPDALDDEPNADTAAATSGGSQSARQEGTADRRAQRADAGQSTRSATGSQLDRELSLVRHTLVGWFHQVERLSEPERARLESFFIEEMLPVVDSIIKALNQAQERGQQSDH